MSLRLVLWCSGTLAIAVTSACVQSAGSQGPQNPSFELEGCDSLCSRIGPSAAIWESFQVTPSALASYTMRIAGTGFMPTSGTYFVDMPANSNTVGGLGIRQDAVDLSTSTALLFDYEATGTVPAAPSTGTDGIAKVEILFTSMGTTTLWSKNYPHGAVNEQQRDVSATVGSLGVGRLTIQVTVASSLSGTLAAGELTNLDFKIDNLRVQ